MSLLSEDREPFRLLPMQGMSDQDESDLFSFSGSVGPNGENRREDVIKAQILLGNSGDFDLASLGAPTGWPGGELYRGIKRYQKRRGAEADGLLLPLPSGGVDQNGVGQTLAALRDDLGDKLAGYAVPIPKQVDAHYEERAKRLAAGDESDSGAPYSEIVVVGQNGTLPQHPIGVMPSVRAEASQALPAVPPPQLGLTVREATSPAAKTGQQVAFLDSKESMTKPMVGPGGGGAAPIGLNPLPMIQGLIATGAAALKGDAAEPKQPADHDQARTPDPAQPEDDKQQADAASSAPKRGRIVIAEDGRELHVPPLEPWADELKGDDRRLAESLNDALAIEMAKGGGGRGNLLTQHGVNIVIQECLKAGREEFPDAKVEHVHGGNQDGDSKKARVKEEHLWEYTDEGLPVRRGSRRPDWGIVIARNIVEMARGNTVDTKKNGESSTREAEAEQGIKEKIEGEKMAVVGKAKPPMTEEEFRAAARKVCVDTMKEIRMDWTRRGEFEKPAPKQPSDYAGPTSARKAAKRRRLLGK